MTMLDQVSRDEMAEALREILNKHLKTYRDAGAIRRKFQRILDRYDNEPAETKHDPDRMIPVEVHVGVFGPSKSKAAFFASHDRYKVQERIGKAPSHIVTIHALVPLAPLKPMVKGVVLKKQS